MWTFYSIIYSRAGNSRVGEFRVDVIRGRWTSPDCTVERTRARLEK